MYSVEKINEIKLQYSTQGFVHLKNVIPHDILVCAKEEFDKAGSQNYENWRTGVKNGTEDARFFDIPDILDKHPVFVDLVDLHTIFPILLEIVGQDIQLNHTHARLFFPGPTFTSSWHSDIPHVLGIDQSSCLNFLVKVHFYIEDMASNQGCLAFIPGSHRLGTNQPRPFIADIDNTDAAIKIVPKAGDAILFNTNVLHMATDNSSEIVRKSIIYAYSHYWVKHYANSVPTDIDRFATTLARRQLFGVDLEGVPYFSRRLDMNKPQPWYSSLLASSKRLTKLSLMKRSYFPNK
jgi:ectoine hydroxylase-related dioxygenase (phytanoyl-CoA dioxygenase family)